MRPSADVERAARVPADVDRIEVLGLQAFGYHGVLPAERREGQRFVVDVFVERDLTAATASDDVRDTTDYATLAQRVAEAVRGTQFALLEALAAHLADLVLTAGDVGAVEVRVAKPDASLPADVDEVAVRLRRERGDRGSRRP